MTPSDSRGFEVLICAHRVDDLLERAIASCFDQTLVPDRVVLVLNGEAALEGGRARIEAWQCRWPDLLVERTRLHGVTPSHNLGLHLCRAPLVARLDSDDVALRDRFARQVEFLRAHPEIAILGMDWRIVDATGQVQRVVEPPKHDAAIRRWMPWRNPICHPSVMFRREAILALGGYGGGLHAEDYDLFVRATRVPGLRFANLPGAGIDYRAEPGAARGSPAAYASMATTQLQMALTGAGPVWFVAPLASLFKLVRALIARRTR